MRACPDSDDAVLSDGEDRRTIALVTQKFRGEVAAIDLHANTVIDEMPWLPGAQFLPVGANPTSIVSTPGGIASFVGVAEPGLEAIYALPTTCIDPPKTGDDGVNEPARELTLWAACRLPSRPGELAIVADPTPDATGLGSYRATCPMLANRTEAEATEWRDAVPAEPNACPADLQLEEQISPVGRRKLLVTLPDDGLLAIYDAQAILNQPKGSFGPCIPDSVIALKGELPPRITVAASSSTASSGVQRLPADLDGTNLPVYDVEVHAGDRPQPAGIAFSQGKLYVADLGYPVIHEVDLKDPCSPSEVMPLQPLSFDEPSRAVYTRDLSVSALTLEGKANNQRFLYAVDDRDGSALAFDLSDGASRAPILRPHTPELPAEPVDRIRFTSPINKVLMVTHDVAAVDPSTDTTQIGIQCSPYPGASEAEVAYRTAADYSKGAGPAKLRGIFGIAALRRGAISVVDVEDWDAPCRRPKSNNLDAKSGAIDWLGCANDPKMAGDLFFDPDNKVNNGITVNDESSCNIVEPHRVRSGRLIRMDSALGVQAPSVVAAPRLSSPLSGDLPTGKSDLGLKQPQMLAVAYTDQASSPAAAAKNSAFVNIGTTRYEQYEYTPGQAVFDIDPAQAVRNTLILPLSEPRIYGSQEAFTATFEGTIVPERASGQLPSFNAQGITERIGITGISDDEFLLRDPDAAFCNEGIQDYDATAQVGRTMLGLPSTIKLEENEALKAFVATYTDFVVLTSDFEETEPYFALDAASKAKRSECITTFGTRKDKKATREFMVRHATAGHLVLKPREVGSQVIATISDVQKCFPSVHKYEVRAGKQWVVRGAAMLSHMRADSANHGKCVNDTDVRRAKYRGRAFEISSSAADCTQAEPGKPQSQSCAIGPADRDPTDPTQIATYEVCVTDKIDGSQSGVQWSTFGKSLPKECLFDSLKARFAIYRGQMPTVRDMAFKWTVTGGFTPMSASIASASVGNNVTPEDMVYSESLDALVIVDSASGGLNLVGMGNFKLLVQPFL